MRFLSAALERSLSAKRLRLWIKRSLRGTYGPVLALCLTLFSVTSSCLAKDVVVIVHRNSRPQAPVAHYVLTAMLGMRLTTWPEGIGIRVFVLPDNDPVHISFCKQVLRVFPHQLRTAWDRLLFSGTGQAPEVVSSEQEMRARVAHTAGALGYLTKEMIDDTVAVLSVE